ncbi:MAG: CoA transferase [Candidatus Adiutricales bacterium]
MMQPLEGIKVVDLSTWIMAPVCAATLGDWGAEVIKIEPLETGDDFRWFLNVIENDESEMPVTLFQMNNRNKRGMAIDIKEPEGREIMNKLIGEADIFVSNIPMESLASLGMDYSHLSAINPRLIYAHATGFGDKGPDAPKPGFDATAYWARSGMMAGLAFEGGEPISQPTAGIGDQVSGLVLFGGVLPALYNRERTGRGQEVDLSLLGVGTWVTSCALQFVLSTGGPHPRLPRDQVLAPLSNHYQTKDDKWIYLACLPSDPYWEPLCQALALEDLIEDPRFNTLEARVENSLELISILDRVFASKTGEEWGRLMDDYGIVWSHIPLSFEEVTKDPQILANNYIVEVDHPSLGPAKIVNTPIHLNKKAPSIRRFAPELGQHTEEILLELNYTWEEIGELQEKGVIP